MGRAMLQRENKIITKSSSFFKPNIQKKLSVGSANNPYEAEADNMANKVMRMSEPSNQNITQSGALAQRKCNACEQEEKAQKKPLVESITPIIQRYSSEGGGHASNHIENQINNSRGEGSIMDNGTKSFMESRFGTDFSDVKIHKGSQAVQMSKELSAQAFTVGNDIYFNEGKYSPNSDNGKHLLAHELTHTVQQGSKIQTKGNKTIQRYFDEKVTGSATGNSYRISDDLTMAVKIGYPNHEFYAAPGKADISNTLLAGVGSGIQLVEESTNFNVSQESNKNTLKRITPKNLQNSTAGNSMKISDDCRESCAVVVGGNKRSALYRDAKTGKDSKTISIRPSLMKAEIMQKILFEWLTMASTTALKTEIRDTLTKAMAKLAEIIAARTAYKAASDADKKEKYNIYWDKVDECGDIIMEIYNKMPEAKREEIDKYLKINRFVPSPLVGQGYTMSSGGTDYPEKKTWIYHWAGVVMKSNDEQDTVTLENYATGRNEENGRWDFAMYGNSSKEGQTFHERHHATEEHGDRPTTMTIEKND